MGQKVWEGFFSKGQRCRGKVGGAGAGVLKTEVEENGGVAEDRSGCGGGGEGSQAPCKHE